MASLNITKFWYVPKMYLQVHFFFRVWMDSVIFSGQWFYESQLCPLLLHFAFLWTSEAVNGAASDFIIMSLGRKSAVWCLPLSSWALFFIMYYLKGYLLTDPTLNFSNPSGSIPRMQFTQGNCREVFLWMWGEKGSQWQVGVGELWHTVTHTQFAFSELGSLSISRLFFALDLSQLVQCTAYDKLLLGFMGLLKGAQGHRH